MGVDAPDGFKQCPDCAEWVRNEARKCRFCGYRFEEPPKRSHSPAAEQAPSSVPELLAQWGSELESGEKIAFFLAAQALGARVSPSGIAPGFLLVTDRRLAFYAPKRRSLLRRDDAQGATTVLDRRHDDRNDLQIVSQRWHRAEIRVGGITLRGIPRRTLDQIRSYLQ